MQQNNTKQLLGIALRLLIICTVIATIVAFVNYVTKDKIELNQKISTAEALTGIYGSDFNGAKFTVEGDSYVMKDENGNVVVSCEEADCEKKPDVTNLYMLRDADGNALSFCVAISPMGFKDKISMLVAINPTVGVKAVKIVSLSETSGIGTKVQEDDFLDKFVDKSSPIVGNVDTISGATKSSKPVIGAVETALEQVALYTNSKGGAE